MKRTYSLLCFVSLFVAVAVLSGCEGGPDHRTADFSPNGMMVAVITNDMEKDHVSSSISIRRADSEDARSTVIYTAAPKMKIYDVFWKNDRMIAFESGEDIACPGSEKLESANAKEQVPRFDIRIIALEGSFTGWLRSAKSRELFKASYPCWKDVIKTEKGWRRNRPQYNDDRNNILEMTNISNARDADLVVFEPLGERGPDRLTGLILLDTKTGEMTPMLEGRKVSSPSISWDGKKVAFIEEIGSADKPTTVMKIANIAGGAESEVMMIADLKDERPMWSKDGKYLFIPGVANIAYTTECDRKYVESEYKKMKAEAEKKKKAKEDALSDEEIFDEIYSPEAAEKGLCKSYRGLVSENDRDPLKAYRESALTWYSLHKFYTDMGIAVKLMDQVNYFSVNPETGQILVSRLAPPVNEKEGLWLLDYSGREIREVKYDYVQKFDAVNKFGIAVGVAVDSRGSVPVILDSATDTERPVIGKKQDLLTLANFNFDNRRYSKAKSYFEQYVSKYGLPKDSSYRLLMIATYRETKDFEKMMKLARTVPVAEIQRYFAVSGKI